VLSRAPCGASGFVVLCTAALWDDPGVTDEEIFEAIRARVQEGRLVDGQFQPDLAPPASEDDLRAAERVIGFPLPPLLRRLYGEIANGGFGPSLGVEGLPGGHSSDCGVADDDCGMLALYGAHRRGGFDAEEPPPLPLGVLFFCDFGCATWSLLDCRHPQGQMWWWNMGERDKLALTLPQWLSAWLEGRIDVVLYSSTLVLADEAWSRPDD
jgi:SMI1 / KNR4 family (SUKH-1)